MILSRGTNSPVSQVRQTQNTNWIHDLESKPWIWILTYINPFWDFPFTACMENGKTGMREYTFNLITYLKIFELYLMCNGGALLKEFLFCIACLQRSLLIVDFIVDY